MVWIMGKTVVAERPVGAEELKRQTVLTKPRKTVLVKIFALRGIKVSQLGLERWDRDDEKIDAHHAAEAKQRGLDFKIYRKKGDTGYLVVPKGKYRWVSVVELLTQFKELGLKYVSGHWQEIKGKGPTVVLNFGTEGEEQRLPAQVRSILAGYVFADVTIWANLKYIDWQDESKGQFRLDTINLANPQLPRKGNTKRLVIPTDHPNTYRVVG